MKRRVFLQIAVAVAAPETPAQPVNRVTRLLPEAPTSSPIRIIPDILALDDKIVALRRNQPSLFASKQDGTFLWEHPLPQTQFATITGVDKGGSSLVQLGASKLGRLDARDRSFTPVK